MDDCRPLTTTRAIERMPCVERRSAAPRVRVLLVVEGRYPSTGGAELQVRTLSRGLLARGDTVRILAPRLDPTKPAFERIDGVEVERITYPRIPRIGAAVLLVKFAWLLLMQRGQYDAVHVHAAKNLATVAGAMRPWLRANLVVKISGAWEFEHGILDPAQRGRWSMRLRNACIARADAIQCISAYTKERLVEAGYAPSRLRWVPNAVDLDRFSPADAAVERSRARVLFVGRLVPVKALPVLLAAWKHVVVVHPNAELLVAGDGPERAALERIVDREALNANVRFEGEVQDVPALMRTANVYVQPSYTEGMPNAVLEAMACGLPVVATRVSGNEDLVDDGWTGWLVPAGDCTALAAALIAVLGDLSSAAVRGARGRARVEAEYGLPAVLDQLAATYVAPRAG